MSLPVDLKAVLTERATPLAQVVKAVAQGERALADAPQVAIGISGNVTLDLLGLFMRREALLAGVRADIVAGSYHDPLGDLERFVAAGVERMLLLDLFDNLLPAFEAQIETLEPAIVDAKEAELRGRLRLVLERAAPLKSVWLALFHRRDRSRLAEGRDSLDAAIERFNRMLSEEAQAHPNVQLVDVGALVAALGSRQAYDERFYFRSKAPYSAALLAELARRLALMSRGFGCWFYKALALDCDNTLWGGIVGEDLLDGIKLDPFDYPGNIFWRVQQMLSALERNGLLLCLCTKNNPADVDEVFRKHPNMVLRDDQIVARRVNWNDKVANLVELSEELNIGLESIIFLDDNPVEAASVRTRLPMVRTFEVPSALPNYPALVEDIAELYLAGGVTAESRSKTEQYRQRAGAAREQTSFESHEDYLASLDLAALVRVDAAADAPRVSELSLKSNQFNLTTRRYQEAEIRALMESVDCEVLSITVSNRFGNAGLTGVVVLRYEGEVARIENFLMSCRVLGQGVELSIWRLVAERASKRGCTRLEAEYLPTAKNGQAADFYDRAGFTLISDDTLGRRYAAALASFAPPLSSWVKVQYDR